MDTERWNGYRKMYLYFFYLFGIIYAFLMFKSPLIAIIFLLAFILAILILFGLYGNYIYAMHVYKKLTELKFIAKEESELRSLSLMKGGASWVGVLVVLGIGLIISILAQFIFSLIALILAGLAGGISGSNYY